MSDYCVHVSNPGRRNLSVFQDSLSYEEKVSSIEDAKEMCISAIKRGADALIVNDDTGDIIYPVIRVKGTGEYIDFIPLDNSNDVTITWEKA